MSDDFDWPPAAEDVSVCEVGPDAWQTRSGAPRQAVTAGQRERPQPAPMRAVEPAPEPTARLARVVTASAIVAAAAACALYAAYAWPAPVQKVPQPPPPVQRVHHPASPVAATPPLPPITIVATYPVEPAPSIEVPASHEPAVDGATAEASVPGDSSDPPRLTLEATPVEAPSDEQTPPGPSETAPPPGEPEALDPGANPPGAGGH